MLAFCELKDLNMIESNCGRKKNLPKMKRRRTGGKMKDKKSTNTNSYTDDNTGKCKVSRRQRQTARAASKRSRSSKINSSFERSRRKSSRELRSSHRRRRSHRRSTSRRTNITCESRCESTSRSRISCKRY